MNKTQNIVFAERKAGKGRADFDRLYQTNIFLLSELGGKAVFLKHALTNIEDGITAGAGNPHQFIEA